MIEAILFALMLGQEPVVVTIGSHPYRVNSSSMEPTAGEGDVVVANRPEASCGSTIPEPGDVVIVRRNGAPWVRRIVAGPGDTVAFVEGALSVNGEAVSRELVTETTIRDVFGERTGKIFRETLPNGRQYLTQDLEHDGDFDNMAVTTVPSGHWFTVGDNRDNAIDARFDGPTDADDLCGIVYTILASENSDRVGKRP